MNEPDFPPLFTGQRVEGAADPFNKARAMAAVGCDAGLIVYNVSNNWLRAAVVLAPEVPLAQAVAMIPACGVGFQNALGALAPPEVAVHLGWAGTLYVNGAACGRLRAAAATEDLAAEPNWLIVGFELPLWPESDQPGQTPDKTALYAEGCADVDPIALLESWAKHTLIHINTWADGGTKALHKEWKGLAKDMGEEVQVLGRSGTYLGVDEDFGMLLRDGEQTHLLSLTDLLEKS